MSTVYSLDKRHSLLLLLSCILLALLMLCAGILTGMMMQQRKMVVSFRETPAPEERRSPDTETARSALPEPAKEDAAVRESTASPSADAPVVTERPASRSAPPPEPEAVSQPPSEPSPAAETPLTASPEPPAETASVPSPPAKATASPDTPASATPVDPESADAERELARGATTAPTTEAVPIDEGSPLSPKRFSVIVGSFVTRSLAEEVAADLEAAGYTPELLKISDPDNEDRYWYEVQIGDFADMATAYALARDYEEKARNVAVIRPIEGNRLAFQKKNAFEPPPGADNSGANSGE